MLPSLRESAQLENIPLNAAAESSGWVCPQRDMMSPPFPVSLLDAFIFGNQNATSLHLDTLLVNVNGGKARVSTGTSSDNL